MSEQPSSDSERERSGANGVAIGIVLGLPLGSAIGMLAFDNFALGGALGLSIGIVLGTAIDARRRDQSDDADADV